MWTANEAEKATQAGARVAVATDMIPNALLNYSFAVQGGLPQGSTIDSTKFGGVTCLWTGSAATCTCKTSACGPSNLISNQTSADQAFTRIVDRMKAIYPQLTNSMIQIEYNYSGIGYAGDPNGSDVDPLVKVSLRQDGTNSPTFKPITLLLFGASIPMPGFSAALTMEDGQGTVAN